MERTGTAANNGDGDGQGETSNKKIKADVGICDNVLLEIFFRLPVRSIVRCALLSRHHRQLIGDQDPDFWLRRLRHGPPLPRPHITYMATAAITAHSLYNEFHHLTIIAGGGGGNKDLRRTLLDRDELFGFEHKYVYVGTCNGVVLLARRAVSHDRCNVIFFNPAVAGSEEAVRVDLPAHPPSAKTRRYRVVGFGYGPSRRRHKLLVALEEGERRNRRDPNSPYEYKAKELLVCNAATDHGEPSSSSRTVHWLDAKISGKSVYLDGKVYLLANHSKVLAFDVDRETVATIDLPGERAAGDDNDNDPRSRRHAKSKLMEMSGRLCVATFGGLAKLAIWLLTPEQRQWERRCDFWTLSYQAKLLGAWDCGGVLLIYSVDSMKAPHLHLSDPEVHHGRLLEELHIPRVLVNPPEKDKSNRLAFCWGYQPTLLSPRIIVGAAGRQHGAGGGLAAALNPMLERDLKTAKERTQSTVCFVDMLLYIMRQLPRGSNNHTKEFNARSLPYVLR